MMAVDSDEFLKLSLDRKIEVASHVVSLVRSAFEEQFEKYKTEFPDSFVGHEQWLDFDMVEWVQQPDIRFNYREHFNRVDVTLSSLVPIPGRTSWSGPENIFLYESNQLRFAEYYMAFHTRESAPNVFMYTEKDRTLQIGHAPPRSVNNAIMGSVAYSSQMSPAVSVFSGGYRSVTYALNGKKMDRDEFVRRYEMTHLEDYKGV